MVGGLRRAKEQVEANVAADECVIAPGDVVSRVAFNDHLIFRVRDPCLLRERLRELDAAEARVRERLDPLEAQRARHAADLDDVKERLARAEAGFFEVR